MNLCIAMLNRLHAPLASTLSSLALAAALLLPSGLAAQEHAVAFSVLGGGSIHEDLTPGLGVEAKFEPGWLAGLQAEAWLGRFGGRLNAFGTQRELETGGDFNLVGADLDLLVRMLEPRAGRVVAPYVAVGAGATVYNGVAGSRPLGEGVYGGDPVYRAHVLLGLGTDIFLVPMLGLRVEVADQLVLPSIGESPEASGLPVVHNGLLLAGLQLSAGAPSPAPVVVAVEAPAPAAQAEVDADRLLYTVQVGSFVEAATAETWARRLRDRQLPVWLIDTTVDGMAVSRMRVGAARSEAEAQRLAAALEGDYGWPVWVDRVRVGEDVPAGAVPATRSFLSRR